MINSVLICRPYGVEHLIVLTDSVSAQFSVFTGNNEINDKGMSLHLNMSNTLV